jgi:hypothetical protein
VVMEKSTCVGRLDSKKVCSNSAVDFGSFLMSETGPSNPAHEDRVLADRILPSLENADTCREAAHHASSANRSVGAFLSHG